VGRRSCYPVFPLGHGLVRTGQINAPYRSRCVRESQDAATILVIAMSRVRHIDIRDYKQNVRGTKRSAGDILSEDKDVARYLRLRPARAALDPTPFLTPPNDRSRNTHKRGRDGHSYRRRAKRSRWRCAIQSHTTAKSATGTLVWGRVCK
jgi:hypothetical protein